MGSLSLTRWYAESVWAMDTKQQGHRHAMPVPLYIVQGHRHAMPVPLYIVQGHRHAMPVPLYIVQGHRHVMYSDSAKMFLAPPAATRHPPHQGGYGFAIAHPFVPFQHVGNGYNLGS